METLEGSAVGMGVPITMQSQQSWAREGLEEFKAKNVESRMLLACVSKSISRDFGRAKGW